MPLDAPWAAMAASSVAGGQTTTTARGASPVVRSRASSASSLSECVSPFIFQFPAISGERVVNLATPASCAGQGFALTPAVGFVLLVRACLKRKGLDP